MDAEERIATLVLLGCAFWRRPLAPANDAVMRFIYKPKYDGTILPRGSMLIFGRSVGSGNENVWRMPTIQYKTSNIEIPFEPRLIGFIPETLFMQFVRNLTR